MFECISYNDQNKDMFHCNILSYFNLLLRFNLVANADTQKSSFFVVIFLPNDFYMTQYLNIMLITVLQSNCVVPADK